MAPTETPLGPYTRSSTAAIVLAHALTACGTDFEPAWSDLDGRPVLAWTVAALAATPAIQRIALVVAPHRLRDALTLAEEEHWPSLDIVTAGAEPGFGLLAGLQALPSTDGLVVVLEGSGPLVTPKLIEAGLATARREGAAMATEPVKETIKRVRNGIVTETLERAGLASLHTPVVFDRTTLLNALQAPEAPSMVDRGGPLATLSSIAMLALSAGIRLATYPGGAETLQVRTPDDLALAGAVLAQREANTNKRRQAEKDGTI